VAAYEIIVRAYLRLLKFYRTHDEQHMIAEVKLLGREGLGSFNVLCMGVGLDATPCSVRPR